MRYTVKKALALLLACAMLVGLIAVPASASTAPTISTEMTHVESDIYKISFMVDSEGLNAINVVFSFDPTQVVPVHAVKKTDVNVSDGSTSTTVFGDVILDEPANLDENDPIPYSPIAKWVVQQERVGFQVAYKPENPDNKILSSLDQSVVFAFYFRAKVSVDDFNKTTFRIETDKSEDSILAALYKTEDSLKGSCGLLLQDAAGTEYTYNKEDGDTLGLALDFTGSDRQSLGKFELNSDSSVDVPVVYPTEAKAATVDITATASDTDGEPMKDFPSDAEWSLENEVKGVSLSGNGDTATLTVAPGAAAGAVTVKIASGSVTATKEISIDRDVPAAAHVEIKGDGEIAVPTANSVEKTYIANVMDQYGDEMKGQTVIWSGTTASGITLSDGKLTITREADADRKGVTYELKATVDTASDTKTIKIARAAAVATTIKITSGAESVTVPSLTEDVKTVIYTAVVEDQYGAEMPVQPTWSITGNKTGVTLTGNTITVARAAENCDVTITATYDNLTPATKTVRVMRAAPAVTTVELWRNGAKVGATDILVKPVKDSITYTYTAKVLDQYGAEMKTQNVTWMDTNAINGVTVTNGTVQVASTTAVDSKFTLTATDSEKSAATEITIKDIMVTWDAVDALIKNTTYTYGDANGKTALPASGEAVAGDKKVTGKFSYADGAAVQGAGERTITVSFTADAGQGYDGTVISKAYTVNVAQKPVTVTADNKTKVYGEANPELTFTVPAGALVGKDTKDALAVKLECAATATSPAGTPVDITGTSTSANYAVTVTKGILTITKAAITGFETKAPKATILASDAKNIDDATVKGAIVLPEKVTVTYKDGTAELPIVWANAAEPFNIKGATYTYKGTVTPGDNFNAYATTLDAKLTVAPVTAKIAQVDGVAAEAVKTPVVVAQAKAADAKAYTDVKLPGSIQLAFANTVELTSPEPVTYSDLKWDVPLDTLKTAAVKSKTSVTVTNLPEWITMEPVTVVVEITDKYPVNVTVDAPAGVTYGTSLGDPTPKQTADEDGIDESKDVSWTYLYTGTTAAGKEYSDSKKPTEAGSYKVTATLVSRTHAGSGTSAEFKIAPKDIADESIKATLPEDYKAVYNTKAFEPDVAVKDGEVTLVKGTDYTVDYDKNIDAGTADVKIAGLGNYDAKTTRIEHFTIDKAPIAELKTTVAGAGEVGKALSAGLKDVANGELTWKWFRGEVPIAEAKSPTYILTVADAGAKITVQAVSKEVNYTGTALISDSVDVAKLAVTGSVVITSSGSGAIALDDVLTANVKGLLPAEAQTGVTYQWYRNNAPIDGASSGTYTVAEADAAAALKVVVTPDADHFTGALEASVTVGKSVLSGTVTLALKDGAEAKVGSVIAATAALTPATEADYSLVWLRDGTAIPGAAGGEYTITAADQGKTISVKAAAKGETYTGELLSDGIAVPAAAPGKPEVRTSVGDGSVTVSWSAPADNGAPITGYTVAIVDGENVEVNAATFSHTFSGLTNGTEYSFTVSAINSVGTTVSEPVKDTPKKSTSSGGGGGGSNPKPTTPDVSDGQISLDVTAKENKDGSFTAAVTTAEGKKLVEAAKKNEGAAIVITPDVKEDAKKVTVDLPTATVKSIAKDTKSDVTVSTPVADVTLGTAALADLAGKSGSTVSVTAEQAEDGSVTVTLAAGGKTVDAVDGGLAVALPTEKGAGKGTVAVLVKADGTEQIIRKSALVDGALVALLDGSATVKVVDNGKAFTDLVNHWAKDSVDFVTARELFNGTGEGVFSPNAEMTRGMLVTVLFRLDGENKGALEVSFNDVATDAWYGDAVTWAAGSKIVEGVGDGVFAPETSITREQLAVMLYRYAKAAGMVTETEAAGKEFADADKISSWAAEAMSWAVNAGLISGKTGGVLDPNGTATRAEVATILQRFVEYSVK